MSSGLNQPEKIISIKLHIDKVMPLKKAIIPLVCIAQIFMSCQYLHKAAPKDRPHSSVELNHRVIYNSRLNLPESLNLKEVNIYSYLFGSDIVVSKEDFHLVDSTEYSTYYFSSNVKKDTDIGYYFHRLSVAEVKRFQASLNKINASGKGLNNDTLIGKNLNYRAAILFVYKDTIYDTIYIDKYWILDYHDYLFYDSAFASIIFKILPSEVTFQGCGLPYSESQTKRN